VSNKDIKSERVKSFKYLKKFWILKTLDHSECMKKKLHLIFCNTYARYHFFLKFSVHHLLRH
jgi:hypothetical protein